MTTERIEVRLAPEQKRRLAELAEQDQVTISEAIRDMIDERFEARARERRAAALHRLVSREIDNVPDPAELSRQLSQAYRPGGLDGQKPAK